MTATESTASEKTDEELNPQELTGVMPFYKKVSIKLNEFFSSPEKAIKFLKGIIISLIGIFLLIALILIGRAIIKSIF